METKEKKTKTTQKTKTTKVAKKETKPVKKVAKKVETKKTNKASDTSTKSMIRYVPIEKVKTEGNFAKAVCFKPEVAPIVCGIVGIAMLFINNTIARVLGAFFIIMAGLVMFLVKDYKVMDVFSKGILLYGDPEAKTGCFINYDDVDKWEVEHVQGHDTIQLYLKNGEIIIKDSFQADKAMRAIFQFVKEKEIRYIKAEEAKKRGLKLPKFLENFKNKLFKK